MEKQCESLDVPQPGDRPWNPVFDHLVVDDERKFILCLAPKTGSTSVHLVLQGKKKSVMDVHIQYCSMHVRSMYK